MRIIAGKHRRRPIKASKGRDLRPTSERSREAIFNIIEHSMDGPGLSGATIGDIFSGTGALGLEALSRGAVHGVFIDNDPSAIACCRENAASLGEWRNASFFKLDAANLPPPPLAAKTPCAYVFLDPPYGSQLLLPALQGLRQKGWIDETSLCIGETSAKEPFAIADDFRIIQQRSYGAAMVSFLKLS